MTLRDKIMDKYWLEFIDAKGHMVNSEYTNSVEGIFWKWFHDEVRNNPKRNATTSLEEYLK
jgi:acyl-CoA thioesterase FadM